MVKYLMTIAKKDANQPEIEQALRQVGAYVLSTHELKNAFDMLVVFRGQEYIVEVKNPEYAPKKKPIESMLTSGEAECKALVEAAGGTYHIWLTVDDALKAIGAI